VAGARRSSWISTSWSEPSARFFTRDNNGIVVIQLSKVTNEVLDISNGVIPGIPLGSMISNWAKKYQEVLIQDYIPPEAIQRKQ
jgi:hypothetical protein